MGNPVQDTAKTSKQLAQDMARKIAREPFEILKEAGTKVAGTEPVQTGQSAQSSPQSESNLQDTSKLSEADKIRAANKLKVLNEELDEIRRQKIFAEVQRKIANGEEIYFHNLPELTIEQKQVLAAQKMAVQERKKQEQSSQETLAQPSSKPSRRFLGLGPKSQVQRQQTKTERPLPPSG